MLIMLQTLQEEIEEQKVLLDEQDGKIEKLKILLGSSDAGLKQDMEEKPDYSKDGLESVYEIMTGLEKYTKEEVLFYAAQMLAELMDTNDVAIYTVVNRDYARLFSATSAEARKLGNSIKYTDMEELYDELKNGRIYMNKAMDEKLPLMAGAIYEEDEMQVILMFWGISPQQMNTAEVKRLTVVKVLLRNAILSASRYMSSYRSKRYLEGTNVLNEEAFTVLVKTFMEARTHGLTECTLVQIKMVYQDYEDVSLDIACNIRQTDYMGLMEGGKLYILLSNTDLKNAEVVQERLHKLGYSSILKEPALP